MRKKIPLFILLLTGFIDAAYGQKASITGYVVDTSIHQPLTNASIVLLQAKDSFIVKDTRATKDGKFSFAGLADTSGYILFFSYPRYVDYSHKIEVSDWANGVADMGEVSLVQREKFLEEVVVKSRVAAIRIKGDTTEYLADSFRVQPNASVEELLRQLPGLQVDQFGNITAQGQKVKKVLVDGEEFFGDDPTLVTRNLRADMIDKVQVYDKKSDAAAFTGIEDGVRDKTINLKIKEDKNNGIFGKAEAGAGTDGRYNSQGMVNLFKGKRRMAAYGTTGNIGRIGLGSADKEKIGDTDDGRENYNGKGLPTATSAGLHYDKKWNEDKQSINGNYKFNMMDVQGSETTISQNNLPTGLILSDAAGTFNNTNTSHRANAKYIHKFDTTSTVTVYTDGTFNNNQSTQLNNTVNRRGDSSLLYDNHTTNVNDYELNSYNLNINWEKKLKKYGRTISFYLNNNFSNDAATGRSDASSRFYDTQNNQDSTALLNLSRTMNDDWRTSNLNVNYTEPLSTKLALILNYTLYNETAHDDKRSFNQAATDPQAVDTAFSTLMNTAILSNQAGAALNYTAKKMIVKVGNNIKFVDMDLERVYGDLQARKKFTNLNPSAQFNYKFNNYKSLNISYNGSQNHPDRHQMLPFNYNNTQVITFLPNLNLRNSFTHAVNGYFYESKILTSVYYGGNAGYTRISNPIVQAMQVSPSGTYTYQHVNMEGYANNNYYLNTYYSRKIKGIDLQAGMSANFNGGRAYSPINDQVNQLDYHTYSIAAEFFKSKLKKYSIYLVAQGGYTINQSSLQPDAPNNYFFYTLNPSVDIYFLKKFQLHTDANYLWQQQTQAFDDHFNRMIWNAWLGRTFFKNDQLTVKISCNDILNENKGYARTATNTFFSENRYTTIKRFFMIGATWSFTKFNNLKQ